MMNSVPEAVLSGTITSPKGFMAGATCAGLKSSCSLDLGILYSESPCSAAGVFTTNKIKAAPVILCQDHLGDGGARAVVVNSGCANACTGSRGMEDAVEMTRIAAERLGVGEGDVLIASTGLIGSTLAMDMVGPAISSVCISGSGGSEFAKAIMTTDTFPKEIAVTYKIGDGLITVGGCAKGAGMIHPNMGTLLCFLTTDAVVEADVLQYLLRSAVDDSFNMITVDGDTSTNDTVLLLANGVARNPLIRLGTSEAETLQSALIMVCTHLAKCITRDGEGATKLIEVCVDGAVTDSDARIAARTVASSPLVKTAVHGCDPNWGRVIAALGRSGAAVEEARVDLQMGGFCLFKAGAPKSFDEAGARRALGNDEVVINIDLNMGQARATAWGCDLTKEYITINSEYTT